MLVCVHLSMFRCTLGKFSSSKSTLWKHSFYLTSLPYLNLIKLATTPYLTSLNAPPQIQSSLPHHPDHCIRDTPTNQFRCRVSQWVLPTTPMCIGERLVRETKGVFMFLTVCKSVCIFLYVCISVNIERALIRYTLK